MSINRQAILARFNPTFTEWNALSPLTVGNGEFCFTADLTGTQTFADFHEQGMPLATMAQWAWHSFPYSDDEPVFPRHRLPPTMISNGQREVPYDTQPHDQQRGYGWLRENPHKYHLGRLSFSLADGAALEKNDIASPRQTLRLYEGTLESRFTLRGEDVQVLTFVHPALDMLCVRVTSPLVDQGLRLTLSFPYASSGNTSADWQNPQRHTSSLCRRGERGATILRQMDDSRYFVTITGGEGVTVTQRESHTFDISASGGRIEAQIHYAQRPAPVDAPEFAQCLADTERHWAAYWDRGGFVAIQGGGAEGAELQRRILLSQYLTAVNCAGSLPPQETGLTMNSWFGKFHLEMHLWHAAHFVPWGRPELLEKSLWYYRAILPSARERAARQGYAGARWPKMTSEQGDDSPSGVGPLLIWQEPHPIYYATLLYRARGDKDTLRMYRDIVAATAEFMASYPIWNQEEGHWQLGPGLIDAPENDSTASVVNPPFELEYWAWGLNAASDWLEALGEAPNPLWRDMASRLAPLPEKDGRYLSSENNPTYAYPYNHDHPALTGALGLLPGAKVHPETMRASLHAILSDWQLDSTWGWDYPMLAMCAARLGEPDTAVQCLLMDAPKNTYLPNGHNQQGSRSSLPLYLPGNGGLLLAVALMCAGWDGCDKKTPGFPEDWNVAWEDIQPLP